MRHSIHCAGYCGVRNPHNDSKCDCGALWKEYQKALCEIDSLLPYKSKELEYCDECGEWGKRCKSCGERPCTGGGCKDCGPGEKT